MDGKIKHICQKWQRMSYLHALLWGAGLFILALALSAPIFMSALSAALAVFLVLLISKPWSIDHRKVIRRLNHKFPELEYSSQLLDTNVSGMNSLEVIQAERTRQNFSKIQLRDAAPTVLWPALIFLASTACIFFLWPRDNLSSNRPDNEIIPMVPFAGNEGEPDFSIAKNDIQIRPPEYTGLPVLRTSEEKISVIEGSMLTWTMESNMPFKSAVFILNGDTLDRESEQQSASYSFKATTDAILEFRVVTPDSLEYQSPLIAMKVIPDTAPEISIEDQPELTAFDWNEDKTVQIDARIRDDFGLTSVDMVATVSRGSGESVKFREERISLGVPRGARTTLISHQFRLDSLDMMPGDELYYYIEARDNRVPVPRTGKSQTYFVQIRDTATYDFVIAGDLGADVMPEYFRSQRQIIIDTEKLLGERAEISQAEFNERSNNLAADQKALRMRYGQFMGDETEGVETAEITESDTHEDHDHAGHDHDDESAGDMSNEAAEMSNTLDDYMHNHGDPEASSFFKVSLKAKLRAAMDEMWDAELHLRLYEPEKSLPFQYAALELIKEIKNDARIYVHRIGFEPPPIRPEARLSGSLENVRSNERNSFNYKGGNWEELRSFIGEWNAELDHNRLQELRGILGKLASGNPTKVYDALNLTDQMIRERNYSDLSSDQLRALLIDLLPKAMTPIVQPEQPYSSLRSLLQEE